MVMYENSQKTQSNQCTLHNLQSHLAWWLSKLCTLIRNRICETLVKMQYFRHEYSSIMYENTQKHNKINGLCITCGYIWHINISKWSYQLDTHSMKVWWRYLLANTTNVHYCVVLFRQCFWPTQTKSLEYQKFYIRIN